MYRKLYMRLYRKPLDSNDSEELPCQQTQAEVKGATYIEQV
jgi:hypothetical protein